MKRITPVLLYLLMVVSATYAQTVPNGGFEGWSSTTYQEFEGWTSSNSEALRYLNMANVTQTADKVSGNYAIVLETKISANDDTVMAYIANGDPGDMSGGIAFSQKVTGIKGFYKCDITGNDFGVLWLIFKKGGNPILDTIFTFNGTQNTYSAFNFNLNLPETPDSVIIAAAPSDPEWVNLKDGSWLQFDSLTFDMSGTKISIPNGDFESATNITIDSPDDWDTQNWDLAPYEFHATQTSDKYTGNYALRLETLNGYFDFITTVTSGKFGNFGPSGGHPFTNQTDTLMGYYKYIPQGLDTAFIDLYFKKNGKQIDSEHYPLNPTPAYIPFQVPILLLQTPDTVRIDIHSSVWPTPPSNVGSLLFIDGLSFASNPAGISEFKKSKTVFYPNPAKDIATIEFYLSESLNVQLFIYDIMGKILSHNTYKNQPAGKNSLQFNVYDLEPGIYFYQVIIGGQPSVNKFVVSR